MKLKKTLRSYMMIATAWTTLTSVLVSCLAMSIAGMVAHVQINEKIEEHHSKLANRLELHISDELSYEEIKSMLYIDGHEYEMSVDANAFVRAH